MRLLRRKQSRFVPILPPSPVLRFRPPRSCASALPGPALPPSPVLRFRPPQYQRAREEARSAAALAGVSPGAPRPRSSAACLRPPSSSEPPGDADGPRAVLPSPEQEPPQPSHVGGQDDPNTHAASPLVNSVIRAHAHGPGSERLCSPHRRRCKLFQKAEIIIKAWEKVRWAGSRTGNNPEEEYGQQYGKITHLGGRGTWLFALDNHGNRHLEVQSSNAHSGT